MATVWRGFLSFGLVSIPIRLHKAARAEKISFRLLHREAPPEPEVEEEVVEPPRPQRGQRGAPKIEVPPAPEPPEEPIVAPVQRALVTAEDPSVPLPKQEVIRGFEYDKNRYVVVEEEDLRAITPKTAQEMQILEFVKLSEIDPLFFENSYYVSPDRSGEKPYSLLYRALHDSGSVALAEVAMHRREHVIVLRPGRTGIVGHSMFYVNEIRRDEEFQTDTAQVNPKELDIALMLVQSMTAKFEPEKFKDKYRERLEKLIEEKMAGKQISTAKAPGKKAEVTDILAALQKSLELVKKPPQPAVKRSRQRTAS